MRLGRRTGTGRPRPVQRPQLVLRLRRDRGGPGVLPSLAAPRGEAWLDEHLPGLVERLVQDEIARLRGDAANG